MVAQRLALSQKHHQGIHQTIRQNKPPSSLTSEDYLQDRLSSRTLPMSLFCVPLPEGFSRSAQIAGLPRRGRGWRWWRHTSCLPVDLQISWFRFFAVTGFIRLPASPGLWWPTHLRLSNAFADVEQQQFLRRFLTVGDAPQRGEGCTCKGQSERR